MEKRDKGVGDQTPELDLPIDATLRLRAKVWLEREGQPLLGHGRVRLLRAIDEIGSITGAAKSIEVSYRHAWQMVDQINRLSPEPVVETGRGGKGGGGTRLTSHGRKLIRLFEDLDEALQRLGKDLNRRLQVL